MKDNSRELIRAKAGSCERERDLVSADDSAALSLDVGEIEIKRPEHAHVLRRPELLKVKARKRSAASYRGSEVTHAGEREAGRPVERNVAAIQFDGEAGVHGNGDIDLVRSGVSDGDRADRSRDSQVV